MADDAPSPPGRPLPRIGSYDLVEPLGSGGMSSVFRARHVESGVDVAVKVLPRSLAKNPTVLHRFLREAKSAEALQHRNIVAIFDRGVDQGRHYLVLEYVHGGDLHDKVRAEGPLPIDVAVSIVRQVAQGLNYAASRGLIHRDIKPANLLLTPGGEVKIIDLGLALQAEDEDERVTREGTTVGTVDYMAPEQARDSRATSIKSDIYSLGCTFLFLLTGQPPFPGGDVAEKLNKHINVPPPEPRARRPEISDPLAEVLLKMLAKPPEARYAGYPELIAALDALGGRPLSRLPVGPSIGSPPPLFAIVDDDPLDADIGLAPESGTLPLAATGPARSKATPSSISLADLAALDRDENRPKSFPGPRSIAPGPSASDATDDEDDDGPDSAVLSIADARAGSATRAEPGGMSASEQSWVTKIVLAGVTLVALVIAADQIIRGSSTEMPDPEVAVEEPAPIPDPVPGAPSALVAANVPAPIGRDASPKRIVPPPRPAPPSPTPEPPWNEPADPRTEPAAEEGFGPGVESSYLPDWVSTPSATTGPVVKVRRIPDPLDPNVKPTLRAAFDVTGTSIVEIADNGPFFADELRIGTNARVIRGAPTYRPLIALERPRIDPALARTAALDLGDRSLVLEGLDIVVDAADLPPTLTALFEVQGGALTFRDCSISVLNRSGRGLSLVKAAPSTKVSRVLFDRTLVRGGLTTVVETSGGASDVVFLRSVVLNPQGSVLGAIGPAAGVGVLRRVSTVRSVLASRASTFELGDTPPRARPRAHVHRALGSTFARFESPNPSSFIIALGDTGGPTELLDWKGEANVFTGWSAWLATGTARTARLAELTAVKATWAGSDATSQSSATRWPLPLAAERVAPDQLRVHAPSRLATLSRVPTPNPWLLEQTFSAFARPGLPGVESVASSLSGGLRGGPGIPGVVIPPPGMNLTNEGALLSGRIGGFGDRVPQGYIPTARPRYGAVGPNPGSGPVDQYARASFARDLTFDAEAPSFQGDLGRFLAENLKPDDTLVRVQVVGSRPHACTPVKVPKGVSVQVQVVPDQSGASPSWSAAPGARGDALIALEGGSLALLGVRLTRDGSSLLQRLIRVDGGHLVLIRCDLRAPGTVETDGGGLVAFQAPGSGPPRAVGRSAWPFDGPVVRPTFRAIETVLSTGGEAIAAEVGRGLVALSDCVVIAGGSAFTLRPGRVARGRFDADLVLDGCTIASESACVTVGLWRGTEPGPDRPWLVSTSNVAVFGMYDRPDPTSSLLRSDPNGLPRGALFWQSQGDALEVPRFLTTTDAASSPSPSRKPDVRLQWVAVWGDTHARGVSGPRLPSGLPSTRPIGPLRPGRVAPEDLAVDPDDPSGRRGPAVGADFSRLGITPAARGGRRR